MTSIDENKIITVHNGIEERFRPCPNEAQILKEKLGIKGPVLLYIGRIAQYKGVDYLIKAYKILKPKNPNLNLVICGKPDYQMEKLYKSWVSEFEDIFFMGYVDELDVPIYYSMADIFITYSSSSEGFGLTPLEALACGTPAICSSITVFKEILGDHVIYATPKNQVELSEKILLLLNNKQLRIDMVKKATPLLSQYSWKSVGEKLEKIYYNFLNN